MKKYIYLLAALLVSSSVFAQEPEVEPTESDTTKIDFGNSELIIVDHSDSSSDTLEIFEGDDDESCEELSSWGGIDMGINVWMTPDQSTDFDGDDKWLQQNYGKSFSWDLNLIEKKIRIVDEYVGIVTGLGLSYKSYGLADSIAVMNKYTYMNDNNEFVTIDSTFGASVGNAYAFTKNKFRTSSLKMPLLLQINTSKDSDKNFHVAGGVIGGWNFSTVVKQEYEFEGQQIETRIKNGYNTRSFTLDAHARIGFKNFTVFATYGLTPFFDDNQGPDIRTATIGVQLLPF